tara:strand:+ start:348 stop:536 length:189 start_codon:yes stop_codon:yes gene_type:complete
MKKDLEMQYAEKFYTRGLIPKWVRENARLNEVQEAILRYYNADLQIPIEWVEEYNELIKVKK